MELQTKLKRRSLIAAGATALVAMGAGITWKIRGSQPRTSVKARLINEALPAADPESPLWRKAPSLKVPLLAQTMYYPRLWQQTIPAITVKALTDGSSLAFLMEWADDKVNDLESIVRFRDAVAVMLPLNIAGDRPPIFMGSPGNPVYILQWKSSWQRDLDKGFQGVEVAYPNWFNDFYPGHPDLERFGMTQEAALPYYPGRAVGNSISKQKKNTAVEELVAEGFGTLTPLQTQRGAGRGVFSKNGWKVSVGMPVPGTDVPELKAGATVPVALAAWDGAERQVGGRKHHSDWFEVLMPGS